jgi:anti-anti-sigma factor
MNIFRINKIDKLPPMVKAIEKYENLYVIKLTGAIDFNTMPPIESAIREHQMQRYSDKDVVLDFKEVTHIDTSTLAVLIYIINRLKQTHQKLCLINCSETVKEYVKIGKLEPLICIHDTLKDIVNHGK